MSGIGFPAAGLARRWEPVTIAAVGVVGGLHLLAVVALGCGGLTSGVGLGLVVFAYTRGLAHAVDPDHLAMIDGSTRKLLGEGRNPAGVGLAFSLGHSSVVVVAGIAVVAGAAWVYEAITPGTGLAVVLGWIGAGISALYLLAVAAANTPLLLAALRGSAQTGPLSARGWSRVLAAPLRRVRHAGHVYVFGVLFGLGFDTASTVAVLMLTAASVSTGAPLALLGLPLAFAAAMTLGDSVNASIMLRVYAAADTRARRRLNIVLLGVSIASAVTVAMLTVLDLLGEGTPLVAPAADASWIGWLLLLVAGAGALWLAVARPRSRAR
ncbi:MAG: hypothetical protein ACK5LS_00635 [Propioniciclava sp.]